MDTTNIHSVLECAVCLQTCIHPTELPCGHIFCFLCVKGVANQSKRCAMCRQEIPCDFLKNPKLIDMDYEEEELNDNEYQWFYEGRNGWWKYDLRTNSELNQAFQSGVRNCELLIAGFLYVIDFESMFQYRRNDPLRRRRIKKDSIAVPSKGVAGIRMKTEHLENKSTPETPAAEEEPTVVTACVNIAQQIRSLSLDTVMGLIEQNSNIDDNENNI